MAIDPFNVRELPNLAYHNRLFNSSILRTVAEIGLLVKKTKNIHGKYVELSKTVLLIVSSDISFFDIAEAYR